MPEALAPANDLTSEKIYDLLGDDAEVTDDEKVITETEDGNKEKKEPEPETKPEETTEETEEEKEPEIKLEDKEEDLQYFDIPNRQAILKEFPELFKKFPTIERAIYTNNQFREVFPTIHDAKEAKERIEDFEKFEGSLLAGDLSSVLKSVKDTDSKAFDKITDNYLVTLSNVDQKSYEKIIGWVISNTAQNMFDASTKIQDEKTRNILSAAAQVLNNYVFGTTEIKPFQRQQQNENETNAVNELKKEREAFVEQQYNVALEDVTSRSNNVIMSTINQHIDPKGIMTDYIKRNAVADVMNKFREVVESDDSFNLFTDSLWKKAFDEDFSGKSKNKIRDAILSKAKTVLPGLINSVRAEALKGQASRVAGANKSADKSPASRGRPEGSTKKVAGEVPKGMSTLQFLMQD